MALHEIFFNLFCICWLIQVIYLSLLFSRFPTTKQSISPKIVSLPSVAVIICARNESKNLKINLPAILKQEYPDYEVIVVNDASSDDTSLIIGQMAKSDDRLKLVEIPFKDNRIKGKKHALTKGINSTTADIILLTDADCSPCSNEWIRLMVVPFLTGADIVLGYSPAKHHGGILNQLVGFETFATAFQYFSFAAVGRPYMGVGRNLAYRKEVFDAIGIAALEPSVPSGDDDLLVNQAAGRFNIAWMLKKPSFVKTKEPHSISGWIKQKTRHFGTARYYKPLHVLILSIYNASFIGFYLFIAVVLIQGSYVGLAFVGWFVRLMLQYIVMGRAMLKLEEGRMLPFLPILDIFHACFMIYFLPSVVITRRIKWK